MTAAQKHFIKRSILLSITIVIYFVLTSTIIDYRQEKKVSAILYDSVRDLRRGPTPAEQAREVVTQEKALVVEIDQELSTKLAGRILLQVDENGEGWYVFPDDRKKYYLGRPQDGYRVMKALSLGIKNAELERYLKSAFPARLSGKILLDIEKAGEAYYVNPLDRRGYPLGRPDDALKAMKRFGLGISNDDLRKIAVGELGN